MRGGISQGERLRLGGGALRFQPRLSQDYGNMKHVSERITRNIWYTQLGLPCPLKIKLERKVTSDCQADQVLFGNACSAGQVDVGPVTGTPDRPGLILGGE
jgi:hypothetical protein